MEVNYDDYLNNILSSDVRISTLLTYLLLNIYDKLELLTKNEFHFVDTKRLNKNHYKMINDKLDEMANDDFQCADEIKKAFSKNKK